MLPLINILIRTSNRPEEFRACIDSVRVQTYKNIRLVVCTDMATSLEYVIPILINAALNYEVFTVASSGVPFHWNFYCNNLKERVTEGWFFYLDDDDTIAEPRALEFMAMTMTKPEVGYICQFLRGSKKKPPLPAPTPWLKWAEFPPSAVVRGKIGGSCIFLHHSQKNVANWDGKKAADYRFIKAVAEKIPLEFVPVVVVKAGNNGRLGK